MKILNGFPIQTQVAIITGVITLINILVSIGLAKNNARISRENANKAAATALEVGNNNTETLEKRRFIDTISIQRIEWINSLRQVFVEFNELAAKRKLLYERINKVPKTKSVEVNDENTVKLFTIKSNIELYLNPGEFFSDTKTIKDNALYRDIADKIHFIEQVILKAEWKRIKDETKIGEQISKEEMAKIFNEVAEDIDDADMYDKLKEGNAWVKFSKLLEQQNRA